jgi:methyl-accepting chemotaxis protein
MNVIAQSASESLSGANMTRESSKEMGDMADELRSVVAQFKI